MKKIGIFYGSSTGTTQELAGQIAQRLGVAPGDVHDVASTDVAQFEAYEVLLLGTSTWGRAICRTTGKTLSIGWRPRTFRARWSGCSAAAIRTRTIPRSATGLAGCTKRSGRQAADFAGHIFPRTTTSPPRWPWCRGSSWGWQQIRRMNRRRPRRGWKLGSRR